MVDKTASCRRGPTEYLSTPNFSPHEAYGTEPDLEVASILEGGSNAMVWGAGPSSWANRGADHAIRAAQTARGSAQATSAQTQGSGKGTPEGKNVTFSFSPILNTPTDLNRELGLTASMAQFAVDGGVLLPRGHEDGAGDSRTGEAPLSAVFHHMSEPFTPSALAHVPGTPPPRPSPPPFWAGAAQASKASSPGGFSLFKFGGKARAPSRSSPLATPSGIPEQMGGPTQVAVGRGPGYAVVPPTADPPQSVSAFGMQFGGTSVAQAEGYGGIFSGPALCANASVPAHVACAGADDYPYAAMSALGGAGAFSGTHADATSSCLPASLDVGALTTAAGTSRPGQGQTFAQGPLRVTQLPPAAAVVQPRSGQSELPGSSQGHSGPGPAGAVGVGVSATASGSGPLCANVALWPVVGQAADTGSKARPVASATPPKAPRAAPPASFVPAPVDASARARAEPAMSPQTRLVYKEFCAMLRCREVQGEERPRLQAFVDKCMEQLPQSLHWRVHLELADLSKREQRFEDARSSYRLAAQLQPHAAQPWLEYAKMEEERGHFRRCQRILATGLRYCPTNESLLLKAVKHHERLGDLHAARSLLGRLFSVSVDRAWRALLEGALLEARTANLGTARRVFKYLLHHAPWCGPIWYEACRFEQRFERCRRALALAEEGLGQLPRYGPLWFTTLRLLECVVPGPEMLPRARAVVQRGARSISKDLIWKLWLEYARLEERGGTLSGARAAYVRAVAACPANLRWKLWLAGARTEVAYGESDTARKLLDRAMIEAPTKVRGGVRLELARLGEVNADVGLARKELRTARRESPHEWKVFLEAVLVEVRAGDHERALKEARHALCAHTATGRLWAALIQLRPQLTGHGDHGEGPASDPMEHLTVFREALQEVRPRSSAPSLALAMTRPPRRQVPKSGEVWCEGSRLCMDPSSPAFNPAAARRFLDFAIEFTPQYGDSFLEYLRLHLLLGTREDEVSRLVQLCINAEPNYGTLWFHCKRSPLHSTRQVCGLRPRSPPPVSPASSLTLTPPLSLFRAPRHDGCAGVGDRQTAPHA